MGLFDRSSSTQNTTLVDQTTTNTNQLDQSGGLLTFAGTGGGIALDLSSRESLSQVDDRDVYDSRSSSSSTSIANSGNTTLSDAGAIAAGRELGLAGVGAARSSVDALAGIYGDSLSALERINADSLTLLGGLVDKSIDASRTLARDSAESTQGFLQQAVSGFGALAKASSEGDADKITRVVGFALLAVAVVVIGPALLRGGKGGVIA